MRSSLALCEIARSNHSWLQSEQASLRIGALATVLVTNGYSGLERLLLLLLENLNWAIAVSELFNGAQGLVSISDLWLIGDESRLQGRLLVKCRHATGLTCGCLFASSLLGALLLTLVLGLVGVAAAST